MDDKGAGGSGTQLGVLFFLSTRNDFSCYIQTCTYIHTHLHCKKEKTKTKPPISCGSLCIKWSRYQTFIILLSCNYMNHCKAKKNINYRKTFLPFLFKKEESVSEKPNVMKNWKNCKLSWIVWMKQGRHIAAPFFNLRYCQRMRKNDIRCFFVFFFNQRRDKTGWKIEKKIEKRKKK